MRSLFGMPLCIPNCGATTTAEELSSPESSYRSNSVIVICVELNPTRSIRIAVATTGSEGRIVSGVRRSTVAEYSYHLSIRKAPQPERETGCRAKQHLKKSLRMTFDDSPPNMPEAT